MKSAASASEKPAPAAGPSTAAIDRYLQAAQALDPAVAVPGCGRRIASGELTSGSLLARRFLQRLQVAAGAEAAARAGEGPARGCRDRSRRGPACRDSSARSSIDSALRAAGRWWEKVATPYAIDSCASRSWNQF